MYMNSNETTLSDDQSKRPYKSPRLEKLTPSDAKERLANAVPKDPLIQQMIRLMDELAEPSSGEN